MKKFLLLSLCVSSLSIFSAPGPHGCPPPHNPHPPAHHGAGPWHHPAPPPHHSSSEVFWGNVAGAALGTLVGNIITTPRVIEQQTTVVTQPVVVQQQTPTIVVTQPQTTVTVQKTPVWVEGRYIDKIQSNGTVIRTWVPGHYE